jgi:thiol-disulfide isomerase/thioredoxin
MTLRLFATFALTIAIGAANILHAQTAITTATLSGKISTTDAEEISVQILEKNLNNTAKNITTTVMKDGSFKFGKLPITEPRMITLTYKGRKASFLVSPKDSLVLDIDSKEFPTETGFTGKGAQANQLLDRYNEVFGTNEMATLYKAINRGIHTYSIDNALVTKMAGMTVPEAVTTLDVERQNKLLTLDALEKELGALPVETKAYLLAEINYDWAYKYLAYGYVFTKNTLPKDYYTILEKEAPLQNAAAIGNTKYQDYVLAYANFLYQQKPTDPNPYLGMYAFIDQYLDAKSAEIFKAAMFVQTVRLKNENDITTLYKKYSGKYYKGKYIEQITSIWEEYQQSSPTLIAGRQQAINKAYDEKQAKTATTEPSAVVSAPTKPVENPVVVVTPKPEPPKNVQQAGTQTKPIEKPKSAVVATTEKPTNNAETPPVVTRRRRSVITGFIINAVAPDVKVHLTLPSLNNASIEYASKVQNGAFFKIDSIDIEEARVVVLEYAHNKMELFLEGNDSLHVEFDADQMYMTPKFAGKGAINNQCFYDYRGLNREEANLFNSTTFRKGIHTYMILSDLDDMMRGLSRTGFEDKMNKERKEKQGIIDHFEANKGKIGEGFRQWMWAEINYDWAYKMLVYGYAYGNKNNLTEDYWRWSALVPLKNDRMLGNEKYQRYILAYTNYWYMKMNAEGSPYAGQYTKSAEILDGKTLQYLRAVILVDAINNNNLENVVDNYKDFLYQNHNPFYAQILSDMYQQKHRYSAGSPAPVFALQDNKGQVVSLQDFKGKVVYVDFWATWCGACIRKMALMQETTKAIMQQDPNVVFVHISLDKNVSAWQNALQSNNYPGIHLNSSEGPGGALAKKYNISALPEFYVISKDGSFAEKPASHDGEELKALLMNLTKKGN